MSQFCCKEGVPDVCCKGCCLVGCPKCIITHNGYCNNCNKINELGETKNTLNELKMYIKYLQYNINDSSGKFDSIHSLWEDYHYIKFKNSKWKEEYNRLKNKKTRLKLERDKYYDCKRQKDKESFQKFKMEGRI